MSEIGLILNLIDSDTDQLNSDTDSALFPAAMMYVKILYDTFYLTFNQNQTYLMTFENQNLPNETLRATETNKMLHVCEHQLFIVADQVFCLERQYYWFFSGDRGETIVPREKASKHSIKNIFFESDVTWPDQG